MIERQWTTQGGAELFQVSVAGEPAETPDDESKLAIRRALAELARAGIAESRIVRSRLWARDAATRRIASDMRIAELAGERRGASASLIDPDRLPPGSSMAIDVVALAAGGDEDKIVQEYAPPIAPPMFVVAGGLVFLSGNTDTAPRFEDQLAAIYAKIMRSLGEAGCHWPDVVGATAFVAKSLDGPAARAALYKRFPDVAAPWTITTVAGFSAPEKLVEIEVTARRP